VASDGIEYELLRFRTRDGGETTVYLVRHPRARTRVVLKCFQGPQRRDEWCARERHPEAIVAGFFVRDPYRPLGEVRLGDREGFSGGAAQFDSDITVGRYPRCALGVSGDELLAVCCDGRRSGVDAGLDLGELARLLVSFGAEEAINLDGGGSATLVHRGHLLNRPYSNEDQPAPESRPVITTLLFDPA
jgi:hypothetical protein